MADISATQVKQLRDKTGAGIMDCKEALSACNGDMDKSVEFLRKKGIATARKRSGRAMNEGTIQSYIHMNAKIGVLAEITCETDFVSKSDDFVGFAKNVAMHIAATSPLGIGPDDIPAELIDKEREIYRAQALESGKPTQVVEKIVEGKLKKFLQDNCLLQQAYVRDPNITIQDLLNELIAKIGENITIKRFVRFQVGES